MSKKLFTLLYKIWITMYHIIFQNWPKNILSTYYDSVYSIYSAYSYSVYHIHVSFIIVTTFEIDKNFCNNYFFLSLFHLIFFHLFLKLTLCSIVYIIMYMFIFIKKFMRLLYHLLSFHFLSLSFISYLRL